MNEMNIRSRLAERFELADVLDVLSVDIIENKRQLMTTFLFMFTTYWGEQTSVMIRGSSGTGKSELAKAVLNTFPEEENYYLSGGSEKALINDATAVNKADRLYIEELDKMQEKSFIYEILKSLSDPGGIGFHYVRADGTEGTEHIHLEPKQMLTTTTQTMIPPEANRRFITIPMEESQAIVDEVVKMKLHRAIYGAPKGYHNKLDALKTYIENVPRDDIEFIPVGIEALYPIINKESQDITTKIGYFIEIVKAITLFNYKNRVISNLDPTYSIKSLLSTPEDLYLSYVIFIDILNQSTADFDDIDRAILKLITHGNGTITQIQTALKRNFNVNTKRARIEQKLERLEDNGMINKVDKNPRRYNLVALEGELKEKDSIKFSEIVKESLDFVQSNYPDIYEEYQTTVESGKKVTNPFTKEEVTISKEILFAADNYLLEELKKAVDGDFDEEIFTSIDLTLEDTLFKLFKFDSEHYIEDVAAQVGQTPEWVIDQVKKSPNYSMINEKYIIKR